MNPRTASTCALLAASMLGMTHDRQAGTRARSDRWDPHTPQNTREKQAKNRAARENIKKQERKWASRKRKGKR